MYVSVPDFVCVSVCMSLFVFMRYTPLPRQEIYKCRCRAGEYSAKGAGGNQGAGNDVSSHDDKTDKKKKKKARKDEKVVNPRVVLAKKLDEIWSDLGSSEIRQVCADVVDN